MAPAIRAAIVIHRTTAAEVDAVVSAALAFGRRPHSFHRITRSMAHLIDLARHAPPAPPALMGLARLMPLAFRGESLARMAGFHK